MKMSKELIEALRGQQIVDGWVLEEPRVRHPSATGACHSIAFTARHADERRAFVKILDPTPDINVPEEDQLTELERRLAIFN